MLRHATFLKAAGAECGRLFVHPIITAFVCVCVVRHERGRQASGEVFGSGVAKYSLLPNIRVKLKLCRAKVRFRRRSGK